MPTLSIDNVSIAIEDSQTNKEKIILKGISFSVTSGQVLYLLGPNGVGKSALLHAIMGSPLHKVVRGKIIFQTDGKRYDITNESAYERSKLGLYLTFQEPVPIAGVKTLDFLYNMYRLRFQKELTEKEFMELVIPLCRKLHIDPESLNKELNIDYSGGEKKRLEVLTMLLFKPTLIMLDELDSGLDIDSEKMLFGAIKEYVEENNIPLIIVSHNLRIFKLIPPTNTIILKDGTIKAQGGPDLVKHVIKFGYKNL